MSDSVWPPGKNTIRIKIQLWTKQTQSHFTHCLNPILFGTTNLLCINGDKTGIQWLCLPIIPIAYCKTDFYVIQSVCETGKKVFIKTSLYSQVHSLKQRHFLFLESYTLGHWRYSGEPSHLPQSNTFAPVSKNIQRETCIECCFSGLRWFLSHGLFQIDSLGTL